MRIRPPLIAKRQYAESALLFLLLAWASLNWFQTIQHILHDYASLPGADYWRIVSHVENYRNFDLSVLWQQHNEHRIIFPEIVFALDVMLLHGRQILPMAVSFSCYFAIWMTLGRALWCCDHLSGIVRNVSILMAGIIIGWQGNAAVLASPFQIQWPLVQLASVVSLYCLSRVKTSRSHFFMSITIAAAIIGTYSSGNGLLLWVVLIMGGIILRFERRLIIYLVSAAVLADGLYFVTYRFFSSFNVGNLCLHPIYSAEFVGAYLSMPFGGMKPPQFSVWLGLMNVFVVILLLVVAVRSRLLATTPGVVLFGSYMFTLFTVVITAAGRMDPTDYHFSAAKAGRYITVPLVNWAVFVLVALWICSSGRWKMPLTSVIICVAATSLVIGLPKLRGWLQANDQTFIDWQLADLAVENGITDPTLMRKLFPSPGFVLRFLPELRKQHLSVFYDGFNSSIGNPLVGIGPKLTSPTSGEVVDIYPVQGGFELVGWVDEPQSRSKPEGIVFGDEAGAIVGVGRKLPAGFPQELKSLRVPSSIAWVGFVNLEAVTGALTAYIRDKKGLLRIQGFPPLPELTADRTPQLVPLAGR